MSLNPSSVSLLTNSCFPPAGVHRRDPVAPFRRDDRVREGGRGSAGERAAGAAEE